MTLKLSLPVITSHYMLNLILGLVFVVHNHSAQRSWENTKYAWNTFYYMLQLCIYITCILPCFYLVLHNFTLFLFHYMCNDIKFHYMWLYFITCGIWCWVLFLLSTATLLNVHEKIRSRPSTWMVAAFYPVSGAESTWDERGGNSKVVRGVELMMECNDCLMAYLPRSVS